MHPFLLTPSQLSALAQQQTEHYLQSPTPSSSALSRLNTLAEALCHHAEITTSPQDLALLTTALQTLITRTTLFPHLLPDLQRFTTKLGRQ